MIIVIVRTTGIVHVWSPDKLFIVAVERIIIMILLPVVFMHLMAAKDGLEMA